MRARPALRATPLAGLLALAFGAHAGPQGGTVAAGNARIGGAGSLTQVDQSSQRAVVDWRSFSIGAGETVRFNLPGATAAILNRVTGGSASLLNGQLQSNGRVFLLNPNGVLVGPSGVIQTAGFVASTRNLNNEEFMAGGPLTFAGNSAAVVRNLGSISAGDGDVVLAAQRVENAGSIAAPRGTVALLAGKEIWYAAGTQSNIVIRSGVDADSGASGVDNGGLIRAAQVELRSAGGNPWALAVRHTGVIEASTVTQQGGRVLLSAGAGATEVGGAIHATGSMGGRIEALGAAVTLQSTATLDASGTYGGGTILVGGDFQGRNADVQNAWNTKVAAGAQLKADAIERGDGGKVIVWADGATDHAGAISARGGAQGGDGGFAEVSGKSVLRFSGSADLRAPQGRTGNLLLDPTDITIGKMGLAPDPTAPEIASCTGGTCSGTGATSFIAGETLAMALATANVTVTTASSGTGFGDITIDPLLCLVPAFNTSHTLTLDAERDIKVFGALNVVGDGALALLAGRNISVAPALNDTRFTSTGTALPFGVSGGNGGLTLVAGRTDANGTINVGSNSNLGSVKDNTGAAGTGAIRVFGTSAANTTLTGWTQAGSVPVVQGKIPGDAGTEATGVYYSAGRVAPAPPAPAPSPAPAPAPSPAAGPAPGGSGTTGSNGGLVITYNSGQINFGLGSGTVVVVDGTTGIPGWPAPEPFVPDLLSKTDMFMETMAMLGGQEALNYWQNMQSERVSGINALGNLQDSKLIDQKYFSPEVEKHLYFVLAVYSEPPATQVDLATALVNAMHAIQQKAPKDRSAIEQQTLHDLSLAVASARRYGSNEKQWNDGTEIARTRNRLEQLRAALPVLEHEAAVARVQSNSSGPMGMGLADLFSSHQIDQKTKAQEAVEATKAEIRTLTGKLANLEANQGKMPPISDVEAMVKYLSRSAMGRLLAW